MKDTEPIISFKEADIVNGVATVIYGLDMDVYPGDFVYIVGKVGTGKTSIIKTIIAENPLHKGFGNACGFNLNGIKDKEIPFLRRRIRIFATSMLPKDVGYDMYPKGSMWYGSGNQENAVSYHWHPYSHR